jgi:PAS domain S-box-containing protein
MYKFYCKLFLVFALITVSFSLKAQKFRFEYVDIEDGLSQNSVFDIAQDKLGFLWFATQDGLNRYDGYSFTIFKPTLSTQNKIAYNDLRKLFFDKDGNIWIGTWGGGLSKLDLKTFKFTNYKNAVKDNSSLSSNFVSAISQLSDGRMLIGTLDGVLNVLDTNKGTFEHINFSHATGQIFAIYPDKEENIWVGYKGGLSVLNKSLAETKTLFTRVKKIASEENEIRAILEVNTGEIWLGTNHGVFVHQKTKQDFLNYRNEKGNDFSLSSNSVNCIYQTKDRKIWVGTENGLNIYQPSGKNFLNIKYDPNDPTSLNNNNINVIYEDNFGILWLGTYGSGIDKWDSNQKKFFAYTNTSTGIKDLLNNPIVFAINQDKEKHLWIGTYGGGITIYHRAQKTSKHLLSIKGNSNSLSNDIIRAIYFDENADAWIGTMGGGLDHYNPKTGRFQHYTNDPDNPASISSNKVTSLFKDRDGNFWIGTFGGGFCLFDVKKGTFETFMHDKAKPEKSLSNNDVFCIKQDWNGMLWISTRGGFSRFDYKTRTFKSFYPEENNVNALRDPKVLTFAMDEKRKVIWAGTGNGLAMIDPVSFKITTFTTEHGLANNTIYSVLLKDNFVWVATNHGISKFKPETKTASNFSQADGLESNEFNSNSSFINPNGEMFFGGSNGFDSFYPDSIRPNPFKPTMVLTNFKVFNDVIQPGKGSILSRSITYSNEIVLTPKEYSFSIEFAALHFSSPFNNKHFYKLENFDKEWIPIDSRIRTASYSNLEPGEYVFKVKGTNNEGVECEKAISLKITVLPPFYKTWWFRTLTFLFLLITVGGMVSMRIRRLKLQKIELEKQVQIRTFQIQQQKEELQAQAEQLALTNLELEKLSIVASETESAVIIMDSTGKYEWVNDGFIRLYGYTLDEFVSKYGHTIVESSNSEKIADIVEQCVSTHQSIIYQNFSPTKNGANIWVQTTLTPIYGGNGELHKLVAIDADISKLKEAESEINEKNLILTAQHEELTVQKQKIEEINFQLNSSIKYALQIQKSILPLKEELDSYFENFVIYTPRDIVSGDFYWFVPIEKTDTTYKALMAVVDCTGHGVPGAFLSLIGNRILNEIVFEKHIHTPSQILEQLNVEIREALKQDKSANKDGMDVCLCYIEKTKSGEFDIRFSGAKRPLYIYENEAEEFSALRGDRKKIGGFFMDRSHISFSDQEVHLKQGDILYLSTDGIIDQNTKVDRKRFGSKRLISLLQDNIHLPLSSQMDEIQRAYLAYKGEEPQRDDITFVGIKLR